MILSSHAPSNWKGLPAAETCSAPETGRAPEPAAKAGKDDRGILRPELRGEIQGNKVKCLGCSTERKACFFSSAARFWNRHVQCAHSQDAQAATEKKLSASLPLKDGATGRAPKKAKGLTAGKAVETAAKSVKLDGGVSTRRAEQPDSATSVNVLIVPAPDDKVPQNQRSSTTTSNMSQEVVQTGADTTVDRIFKTKPSTHTDHVRSQARNCPLLDAGRRSSGDISTDSVCHIDSRDEF